MGTYSIYCGYCSYWADAVFRKQYEDYDDFKSTKEVGWIATLVFFIVVLITAGNVATTYLECGFQQCPDNPTSYIILDK